MCSDGNNSAVYDVHIFEHLWVFFPDRIFVNLCLFANIVGDLQIVLVLPVLIQSTAYISNCSLQSDGVECDNLSRPDIRQIHLVTKEELLHSFSVFARVVRINVGVGNTGRVHEPEEVQSKANTVHLRNAKQICYHTARHRASAISALDAILFFPFSEVGLKKHKVNGLSRFVDIVLFIHNLTEFRFIVIFQGVWMMLKCVLNLRLKGFFWIFVDVRILCATVKRKLFHHISQNICVLNGL